MKLMKDRHDHVLVGMGATLTDILTIVIVTSVSPKICSVSRSSGHSGIIDSASSRVKQGLPGVLVATGADNSNLDKDDDPAKSTNSLVH